MNRLRILSREVTERNIRRPTTMAAVETLQVQMVPTVSLPESGAMMDGSLLKLQSYMLQLRATPVVSRNRKLKEIEVWFKDNQQHINKALAQIELKFLFRRAMAKGTGCRSLFDTFIHKDAKLETKILASVILALYPLLQQKRLNRSGKALAKRHVLGLILACPYDQVTLLKSYLDSTGTSMNLCRLLFHEFDAIERTPILIHFKKAASSLDEKKSSKKRKILSDVDDTLTCSGGAPLAGIDRSHPAAIIYPGVLQFYKELDLGYEEGSGEGEWGTERQGNLVFLSARPHIPGSDEMERHCHELFRRLRESRLHTIPDMLFGNLAGAWGDKPKALKKAENFKNYRQIYPEYKFVFIGDNGQGDAWGGELMKLEAKEDIEIFIHQVRDLRETSGYKKEWESQMGFTFFQNYIDAALVATKKGLIHPKGLRRVMVKAKIEFNTSVPETFLKFEERVSELNESIARANKLLCECKLDAVEKIYSTGSLSTLRSSHSLSNTLASEGIDPMIALLKLDHGELTTHNNL